MEVARLLKQKKTCILQQKHACYKAFAQRANDASTWSEGSKQVAQSITGVAYAFWLDQLEALEHYKCTDASLTDEYTTCQKGQNKESTRQTRNREHCGCELVFDFQVMCRHEIARLKQLKMSTFILAMFHPRYHLVQTKDEDKTIESDSEVLDVDGNHDRLESDIFDDAPLLITGAATVDDKKLIATVDGTHSKFQPKPKTYTYKQLMETATTLIQTTARTSMSGPLMATLILLLQIAKHGDPPKFWNHCSPIFFQTRQSVLSENSTALTKDDFLL